MRDALPAAAVRFVLVFLLLLTWALGIGRYGGPDEPAHVIRSFAAAHGDLTGDPADPLPPGYRTVSVPEGLASGDPACYRHDSATTSACATASPGDGRVRVATSAGLTPPLYHLAVGGLVRLVGDPADTAWYRVAAAVLHAVVVALAMQRARRSMLVATIAALTPAAWFLLGVVNPSSLEIALALLAWVGVSRFVESGSPTTTDAWWIAAPLALAVAVRPVAAVTACAALVVIELRRGARGRRLVLVAPIAAAAVAVLAWGLAVGTQIDDPRTAVHRSFLDSLTDSLGSLGEIAYDAVGSLGWNEFLAPRPASVAWVLIWIATAATFAWRARGDARLARWRAPIAWLAVLVASPVVFETVMAGSVGPIWQGRYSIPVLIGVVAIAPWPAPSARAAIVVVAVAGLAEVATYWASVRRYAVGTEGSWWLDGAFRSSAWLAPGTWVVVHVATVAVAVALVARCAQGQVK
ncbi:MAG: DUF2142 domain-containing protein [Ilumatobacteraceae bacterium]